MKRPNLIVLTALLASASLFAACSQPAPLPTLTLSSPRVTLTPQDEIDLGLDRAARGVSLATATAETPLPAPADTPAPADATEDQEPARAPAALQHTVQPGETLLGLALHYGVSMAAIQLANDLGSAIDLVAGQTLTIPGEPQWWGEGTFWAVHTVQDDETLVGLAARYELMVDDILRVNAIADPALIHPGQHLVIPLTRLVTLGLPQPTETPVVVAAVPASADPQTRPRAQASETTSATVATAPPPQTAPPPGPPAGEAEWSGYILARINQARAEHGLNPLRLAPELTVAAQAHAEDCARRGWGSHVGSDGAVLKTRLERAGYQGDNWGENWVQALNAERAFDWWYGEIPPNDPHRRNILSPRYTEVGIGIAQSDWGYIFVTDLGRR